MPTANSPIVIIGRSAYRLLQGDIQVSATVDGNGNFRHLEESWTYIDLADWNDECDQAMAMLGGVATRIALDHMNDFAQARGRNTRLSTRLSPTEWSPYFDEANKALAESARARPLSRVEPDCRPPRPS